MVEDLYILLLSLEISGALARFPANLREENLQPAINVWFSEIIFTKLAPCSAN